MKIKIKKNKLVKKLFHNIWLDVYPTEVKFKDITFWEENYRTILPFDLLQIQFGTKSITDIPKDDILDFLATRKALKIPELADSISKNEVKLPLILLQDGTLLDGNRRYFACALLEKRARDKGLLKPDILEHIPVWVIQDKDVDERMKQKILAEANFVPDFKVPWPLDVKARVINEYFKSCKKRGMLEREIYNEIQDVYSVDPQTVAAYTETIKLTNEFIKSGLVSKKNEYREIVQEKFLYFWEFRNKALKGSQALEKRQLSEVKDLFFIMMKKDLFKNFKQVEPMIRSRTDDYLWGILKESSGTKIEQIEALYKEEKAIRSVEDKIRNFSTWLTKIDTKNITETSIKLLHNLVKKCSKLLQGK